MTSTSNPRITNALPSPVFAAGRTTCAVPCLASARARALLAATLLGTACTVGFSASADDLRFAVAAYNGHGELEPAVSGAGQGKFTTTFPPYVGAVATATAVDPALGKLYVAGTAGINDAIAIARYDYDGNLDLNFGNGGRVLTRVDSARSSPVFIRDVAIDSYNRIVVVGHRGSSVLLARYWSNGTLDSSFDGDGILEFVPFGEYLNFRGMAVAITFGRVGGGDRIVISGAAQAYYDWGILIARFLSDGKPDPTFGSGQGFIVDNVPSLLDPDYIIDEEARDVAVDAYGRIVVAGVLTAETYAGEWLRYMQVQRYLSDGQPDLAFGSNGDYIVEPFNNLSHGNSLLIDGEGRIVVAGQATKWGQQSFAIARLTPDGVLDSSFSGDGRTLVAFGTFGTSEIRDIALAANGDVLAAGWVGTADADHQRFALARIRSDGGLDTGFGDNGRVVTDFTCKGEEAVTALAVRPYYLSVINKSFERIYAVGWAEGDPCLLTPMSSPTGSPTASSAVRE